MWGKDGNSVRKALGTDGGPLDTTIDPSGATSDRPSDAVTGQRYFDTTLGQPVWYDGSGWVDATGTTA